MVRSSKRSRSPKRKSAPKRRSRSAPPKRRSRSSPKRRSRSPKRDCDCSNEATIFVLYNWNKFGWKLDSATDRAIDATGWWWVGSGGYGGTYKNEMQFNGPKRKKSAVIALLKKGFKKLVDKNHIEKFKIHTGNLYDGLY